MCVYESVCMLGPSLPLTSPSRVCPWTCTHVRSAHTRLYPSAHLVFLEAILTIGVLVSFLLGGCRV